MSLQLNTFYLANLHKLKQHLWTDYLTFVVVNIY